MGKSDSQRTGELNNKILDLGNSQGGLPKSPLAQQMNDIFSSIAPGAVNGLMNLVGGGSNVSRNPLDTINLLGGNRPTQNNTNGASANIQAPMVNTPTIDPRLLGSGSGFNDFGSLANINPNLSRFSNNTPQFNPFQYINSPVGEQYNNLSQFNNNLGGFNSQSNNILANILNTSLNPAQVNNVNTNTSASNLLQNLSNFNPASTSIDQSAINPQDSDYYKSIQDILTQQHQADLANTRARFGADNAGRSSGASLAEAQLNAQFAPQLAAALGNVRQQEFQNQLNQRALSQQGNLSLADLLNNANLQARGQDINAISQGGSLDLGAQQNALTQRGQDIANQNNANQNLLALLGIQTNAANNIDTSNLQARSQDLSNQSNLNQLNAAQQQAMLQALTAQRGQSVQQNTDLNNMLLNSILGGRGQDISAQNNINQLNSSQEQAALNALLAGRGQDVTNINNAANYALGNRNLDTNSAQYLMNLINGNNQFNTTNQINAQQASFQNNFNTNQALLGYIQQLALAGQPQLGFNFGGNTQSYGNGGSMLGGIGSLLNGIGNVINSVPGFGSSPNQPNFGR